MPQTPLHLIAGLGNPGDEYKRTRHNVGFMVLDKLAESFSIPFSKNKFNVVYGRGIIGQKHVILAKPQAYMNNSGPPVRDLSNFFKILCKDMLVVHDDIDLTFGRIKIKMKGGHGGHKGIRSLINVFGSGEFARIRLGVGRSRVHSVTDHVLGRFNSAEEMVLDQLIAKARDAAVSYLADGITECMNQFNQQLEFSD